MIQFVVQVVVVLVCCLSAFGQTQSTIKLNPHGDLLSSDNIVTSFRTQNVSNVLSIVALPLRSPQPNRNAGKKIVTTLPLNQNFKHNNFLVC